MATKVESWKAEDGTLHPTELMCVRYEVLNRLFKELPQLKVCRDVFSEDSEIICEILAPLVAAHAKDHPEVPEKTTLKPSDKPKWDTCTNPKAFKRVVPIDDGSCNCRAGVKGSTRHHHRHCPAFQPMFHTGGLVNG